MTWMLFSIILTTEQYFIYPDGPYESMEKCFEVREYVMQKAPKPKVNYEAICVKTDVIGNGT